MIDLFNALVSALTLPPVHADLAIAPLLAAALPAVGGALAKFFGGWLGGKSQANNEKKRAAENDAAARRAWDQKEQARVARLKSWISALGARGINTGTIDPSLLQVRPYPGPNSTVGIGGPSFLSQFLGFAGDTALGASQAGAFGGGIPGQADAAARGRILEDPALEELLRQGSARSILGTPGHAPSADVNAGGPAEPLSGYDEASGYHYF